MTKKKSTQSVTIAIDFDGTCVTHDFPAVGKDIGAAPVLQRLVAKGHKLILWTMRSDTLQGQYLTSAVQWFRNNNIPLYGIQRNPTQDAWTSSLKCYAQLYIDDAALGAPIKYNLKLSNRAFIDWGKVEEQLEHMQLL